MLVHARGSCDRDARIRKCALPNVHLPKCMCLNVMLTLPPPLYTPAVLVTVLRTCQTTLCHIFAHQLWPRLPTVPTVCVVAETPPSPFLTTPPLTTSSQPSSHSAHPTASPLPLPPLSTPLLTLHPSGIESPPCRQRFHLSTPKFL